MSATGRRRAVALAVAAAVVAFALAFAVARALSGGSEAPPPEAVEPLPAPAVSIENLERAPSMKPLRSAAGAPAPAAVGEPVP